MFDISTIPTAQAACEAGFTFEPRFPDGTGTGASITVCGPESSAARAYADRRYADMHARELAARRAGRDVEPQTAKDLDEQFIELAVMYTIKWVGVLDGGVALDCTPETARRLYRTHPWLRAQVVKEAQNLGNFIRPSSASSSSTLAQSSVLT